MPSSKKQGGIFLSAAGASAKDLRVKGGFTAPLR